MGVVGVGCCVMVALRSAPNDAVIVESLRIAVGPDTPVGFLRAAVAAALRAAGHMAGDAPDACVRLRARVGARPGGAIWRDGMTLGTAHRALAKQTATEGVKVLAQVLGVPETLGAGDTIVTVQVRAVACACVCA